LKDSVSTWVYALLLGALVIASAVMLLTFPRSGVLWVTLIVSTLATLLGRASVQARRVRWDGGHDGLTLSQVAIPVPPSTVRR